jgi:Rad3-related DNA helicase
VGDREEADGRKPAFHRPGELDDALKTRCGSIVRLAVELKRPEEGNGRFAPAAFLSNWNAFREQQCATTSERRLACSSSSLASKRSWRGPCALLMSGTLHPPEMYADLLGISEDSVCREYANPFPPENRPVLCVRGVSSRYLDRCESSYSRMAAQVGQACRSVPGNLAVFFPSYDFMPPPVPPEGWAASACCLTKGQTKQRGGDDR